MPYTRNNRLISAVFENARLFSFLSFFILCFASSFGQAVSIANTTNGSENGVGVVTDGILTVTQTLPTAVNTVVTYSVAGTATSGVDFTALSGTVTIIAPATSATITIPVLEDVLNELNETVIINLTGVSGSIATLDPTPANTTATNTIIDDDDVT
ncbi:MULTISPECIES: Calx-beta domain-containing protein, partial [unclassified Croceitalea]|uniref:Calx-beta domain-containing protein n=1 Tax=unclassified Croceitalea TaxID=2632280 RepID=UPI0030DBC870